MSDYIDFKVVAQVIGTGLLLGAGLPLVFSLGVRALSTGTTGGRGGADGSGFTMTKNPLALVVGGACLLVVVAAIVFGISIIVNKS